MGFGVWGWGFGDWVLGIGPNPQSPIPNPQSPIPTIPIFSFKIKYIIKQKLVIFYLKNVYKMASIFKREKYHIR